MIRRPLAIFANHAAHRAFAAALCVLALHAPARAQTTGDDQSPIDIVIEPAKENGTIADWQTLFHNYFSKDKARTRAETDACLASTRARLDLEWFVQCVRSDGISGKSGLTGIPQDMLYRGLQRANLALYQNGYINSGFVLREIAGPPGKRVAHVKLVVGQLTDRSGKTLCTLTDTRTSRTSAERHAEIRLMEGCGPAHPLNLYLLERNFRRLADDNDPWVKRVIMKLEPVDGPINDVVGKAYLRLDRPADGIDPSAAMPLPKRDETRLGYVKARPFFSPVIGVANNRVPSIGSWRGFSSGTMRGPLPGMLVTGEVGLTRGALDGSAAVSIELTPDLSLQASGDVDDAAVVDPILRPLDIQSRGEGGELGLVYRPIRCPLTPRFGNPASLDTRPLARRVSDGQGIGACAIAARLMGDAPLGWAAATDVSLGLSLSHRRSRSFLLGMPFSFSPGSVDGRSFTTALRFSTDLLKRGRADRAGMRGWTLAAGLKVSRGLDGSATDIAGLSSPSPHFWSVSGYVTYARQLPGTNLILVGRAAGQWADGLLYTSERFALGGANSVRGYPEAVVLVDRGVAGSVQLSKGFSLNGRAAGPAGFDPLRFRILAFADGAMGNSIGSAGTVHLLSVGAGVAWAPSPALDLRVEYGRRLGDRFAASGDSLANRGFHFSLTIQPFELFSKGD